MDNFYSVSKGEQLVTQVTKGTSTSGEAVELRVSDTIWNDKQAVLNGLSAIHACIVGKGQPLA